MPIDDGMRQESVTAEYLSAPAGTEVGKFARDTVIDEGLSQWNGSPPTEMLAASGYRLLAVVAGDGSAVTVTYRPETNANHICVVRAAFNGTGHAAYRASRWCAARFGIDLPQAPPSPIG